MRARNIKPGFFKNELLGTCNPITSLLFAGLWLLADREGRLEDRPLRIKAEIFPYRESLDINGSLTELVQMGFICRYESEGCAVIQILNFKKHQTPHKTERLSELPVPPDKSLNCTTTCSTPVNPPNDNGRLTEALPPDSSFPDSLNPDSPPRVECDSFFQKCYDLSTKYFPDLETANTSIIYLWEQSGYDFEKHIRPVLESAHKKQAKPRSYNFFSAAIENSAAQKMSPVPKPTQPAKLTEEQREKNRKWYLEKGLHHREYNPNAIRVSNP